MYYIQKQNDNWRKEFSTSPLVRDVPENIQHWGEEIFGVEPDAINFWMGDDRSFSSLHKDFYENLYCVVKGQKVVKLAVYEANTFQNFTLLPPADIAYLHQQEYPSGHFKYLDDKKMWVVEMDKEEASGEHVTVPWIPANPDNPIHYKRFSKLKHTSPLHVRVKVWPRLGHS